MLLSGALCAFAVVTQSLPLRRPVPSPPLQGRRGVLVAPRNAVRRRLARKPSLYLSGNFAGEFTVEGSGTGTSEWVHQDLEMDLSDANATITASGFTAPSDVLGAVGSIEYQVTVYEGRIGRVGSVIAGPLTGTDSGLNGRSLFIDERAVPSNGRLVLRISRRLTLHPRGQGGQSYEVTGRLQVTLS
jgi:hypothetical protein